MTNGVRTTICLLSEDTRDAAQIANWAAGEQRWSEARFAFSGAPSHIFRILGMLNRLSSVPTHNFLPGGIERIQFEDAAGRSCLAWLCPNGTPREVILDLLLHDVAMKSDLCVLVDPAGPLPPDAIERLTLDIQSSDYVGQLEWHEYSQAQLEFIATRPWYLGLPPSRHDGRPGVAYVSSRLLGIRPSRLRRGEFPDLSFSRCAPAQRCPPDVILGEMVRQLGWKASHLNDLAKKNN